MNKKLSPYYPGIILFVFTLIVTLFTYKDYGIAWDETRQREIGDISYNYVFKGDKALLTYPYGYYGVGLELPLTCIEKWCNLTDTRDVYLMRHVVTHLLFLVSALAMYVLSYRLFRNKFLACLGFMLLVFAPRLYAHSWFNSKDIPFLSVFTITLAFCEVAFRKNKPLLFLLLGLLSGYTTSIRIMGIMLGLFILAFLVIDLVNNVLKKEKPANTLFSLALFFSGFCGIVYAAWPYLWRSPLHNFINSFAKLSHYEWNGSVLMGGKMLQSTQLPWSYFPNWFLISNPELWLIAGFTGFVLIAVAFIRKPIDYIKSTPERNFILYLLCFAAPIFSVLALHSVIYDDWRHLYFIYPSFILMALYAINRLLATGLFAKKNYRLALEGICVLQVLGTGWFMVKNHPFQQVYFNNLVSHNDEYLRKNYEMDYWGVSNLQALKYVLDNDAGRNIMVSTIYPDIMQNNVDMLEEEDRNRLKIVHPDSCQYFITNFRFHPDDFPMKEEYSFHVLNSSVIRIYAMRTIVVK